MLYFGVQEVPSVICCFSNSKHPTAIIKERSSSKSTVVTCRHRSEDGAVTLLVYIQPLAFERSV